MKGEPLKAEVGGVSCKGGTARVQSIGTVFWERPVVQCTVDIKAICGNKSMSRV